MSDVKDPNQPKTPRHDAPRTSPWELSTGPGPEHWDDWREFDGCVRSLAPREAERDSVRHELLADVHALLGDPVTEEALARVADMLAAHGTLDETLFADALG